MKRYLLIFGCMVLSGCATPQPIPQDIKNAVGKMPVENLKAYPIIEQQRCGAKLYTLERKRQECKYQIRREKAERKMMEEREQEKIQLQ